MARIFITRSADGLGKTAAQLLVEHDKTIPDLSDYFRTTGKKGGKARAEKLSAKRRKEISAQGNKARWSKGKKGDSSGR